MQATAVVVETDPGENYHRNGGIIEKDKPSKKEKFVSSHGCNEVKLTFPGDEWDSLAAGPRTSDNKINNDDQTDFTELSFSVNQDTNAENVFSQSSQFEDSIDYAFLNETYSIHYSESKLKNENLTHLHSELHPEVHKSEDLFFKLLEPQGNDAIGLEIACQIPDADYKETAEDEEAQENNVDDDSQQEYHSAEQEYISHYLSYDQAKPLSISDLHVDGLKRSGYEGKCPSNLEDSPAKSEHGPLTSSESPNGFAQDWSPHFFKFQDSDMLKEYHEPKHSKGKEEEMRLLCRTACDDSVPWSSSLLNPQKPLKTKTAPEEMNSQTTENTDFYGDRIVKNRMLQQLESPGTLPQANKDYQTSGTSIFDDSVISLSGSSQYKSLQSTPNSALSFSLMLPRIAVTAEQARVEDSSPQLLSETCTREVCPRSWPDEASCTGIVNQTQDVSTDLRASFTASGATSARSSVVSSASNTERIIVNKDQPKDWQGGRRSVACNTDWSCSQDCADARMAVPKVLGGSLSTNCLKPNGDSLDENSLELRKTFAATDIKKHPERKFQLCEEMNLPSKCCQKTVQRAVKAEMHLLNVYYQMCHRHCCRIYKLVMENRAGLNRNLASNFAKKELGSALLSVWGDLQLRYMNLKEKLHRGTPLEELPPLSVESKLLSAFAAFASKVMKEESHDFSGADFDLEHRSVPDIDVSLSLKKKPQMTVSSDNGHLKQVKSPKKDGLRNGGINMDFDQIRLNEKQMKNAELLQREKGFLIHVGGLCSSVSEADLRSHFQKYHVSEISIYDSPTNYRSAALAFTNNSDAEMAVKEMNGADIHGNSVHVQLVRTGESASPPLWAKSGDTVHLNHVEKITNKEGSSTFSVSQLPETRPRQLESEQDSEFSSLDQEGVEKNCKQIESIRLLPEIPVHFIPPNTLNLRSFTKIMKRLAELHPEVSRVPCSPSWHGIHHIAEDDLEPITFLPPPPKN